MKDLTKEHSSVRPEAARDILLSNYYAIVLNPLTLISFLFV